MLVRKKKSKLAFTQGFLVNTTNRTTRKKGQNKKPQKCDWMRNPWDIQNQTVLLTKPLHHILINIQKKKCGRSKMYHKWAETEHFNSPPPYWCNSKSNFNMIYIGQWSIIILTSFIKFLNWWLNLPFSAPKDTKIL